MLRVMGSEADRGVRLGAAEAGGSALAPCAAVAPAWHTVVVLILAMGLSFWGSQLDDMSGHGRIGFYLVVMLIEWAFLGLIWFGVRLRGVRMSELVGGRWKGPRAFFRDVRLGIGVVLIGMALAWGLDYLLGAGTAPLLSTMAPQTFGEVLAWVVLSFTAGFCEEIIFRGYLGHQFAALTRSAAAGIILQAIVFALGHGYQGWKLMVTLLVYATLLGVVAYWRGSLRPGIVAHALQDSLSGVLWYFLK
ncbi:MAG TPA: type II CAAX endopeptidase family protein [Phycisphaerae bacterium]|nr:type II CAAX endopeptidase family protein [Phycisphaerae bacterium]